MGLLAGIFGFALMSFALQFIPFFGLGWLLKGWKTVPFCFFATVVYVFIFRAVVYLNPLIHHRFRNGGDTLCCRSQSAHREVGR